MKKSIFAFAAALAALVACNKNEATPMQPQNQPETLEPCELTVGIFGAMTKATAVTTENEAKVNNLQIFVFRGDDLDAYASVDNAKELTLSCTAGEREVYALVNAPDYSAVPGKAALLAKVSELSANSLTNFEMVGSKSVTLPQASTVAIDESASLPESCSRRSHAASHLKPFRHLTSLWTQFISLTWQVTPATISQRLQQLGTM